MRIAMLGTRGVPNCYGGYETAVEEIGQRLVKKGYAVTVYCRNPKQTLDSYLGMNLVNLPAVRHRLLETLSHTFLSVLHAIFVARPEVIFLFNAGNAPFIPLLKIARIPYAIHVDGLESRREKWRGLGAKYYRWAERSAVLNSEFVIADAQAIAQHLKNTYGKNSTVIAYGAEVKNYPDTRLGEFGIESKKYFLSVARFEPENHVLEIVTSFRNSKVDLPLIVVGSAPYSDWYIRRIHEAAAHDPRIVFVGSIFDQDLLDQLYSNALCYIHGHSVGGTNPSLLRSMGAGAPIFAFDVDFNRETTADMAHFWREQAELTELINHFREMSSQLHLYSISGQDRIKQEYQWDKIATEYSSLAEKIVR